MALAARRDKPLLPRTLWIGITLIVVIESLLFVDVVRRDGLVIPNTVLSDLPAPTDRLGESARWASFNVTPICWVGYLLFFDGLLTTLARRRRDATLSPIRHRPNRFVVAWLTSIPVWCFFDYVNFKYLDAWRYHGLPLETWSRHVGYFVAFAAISPGMFLAAAWFQRLGFRKLRVGGGVWQQVLPWAVLIGVNVTLTVATLLLMRYATHGTAEQVGLTMTAAMLLGPGLTLTVFTRRLSWASLGFGLGFTAWAVLARDPLGNMALWVGLIFLLDPIVYALKGPSILRDWQAGRWGRMLALFAGGALCGLLWEFWNYWALSKWTYRLPFLGALEDVRYFEMPLLGFLGFLPFAVECWVVLNVIIVLMDRVGLRVAEPLPDEDAVM